MNFNVRRSNLEIIILFRTLSSRVGVYVSSLYTFVVFWERCVFLCCQGFRPNRGISLRENLRISGGLGPQIASLKLMEYWPVINWCEVIQIIVLSGRNVSAAYWCQIAYVAHNLDDSLITNDTMFNCITFHVITEGSVFSAVSLSLFCLCMKYLGNRWTDLRQIHTEDVFGPSLGRVWKLRSKVKGQSHQRQKNGIFGPFGGLRAVYVW